MADVDALIADVLADRGWDGIVVPEPETSGLRLHHCSEAVDIVVHPVETACRPRSVSH